MSSSIACPECGKPLEEQLVRALGTVCHLNCFRCMDCGDLVASKFFPIEGQDGRQHPLCERDYFRRLNLICARCDMALRGSFITACNKKFHVEHITCSLCPTLFGPQDSYYEYEGEIYCHFHYSTRFATKCAGCNSVILKQFVEINRNMRDECWHPECYMINKFWNVKMVSTRTTSSLSTEGEASEPAYVEEERRETPISLRENQARMEQQVYRIWTVLSAFEESSAACISDMLRQVSIGQYLEAILLAERFILHVEVLFATIDDLEYHFARLHLKGMSHVREARMLCRKTVDLFTLLSRTQETGARRMGMTQELLSIVTGLAHYLKILIRIALTGALRLDKEHNVPEAMTSFLNKLHLLTVHGANPSARRMIKGQDDEISPNGGNYGTQAVTYGFRSLAPENAGDPPFREGSSKPSSHPASDLCVKCNLTVEEDCVRLDTYQRWHSHCVQCAQCGEVAGVPLPPPKEQNANGRKADGPGAKGQSLILSSARRPPANVGIFMYDPESIQEMPSFGDVPTVILCTDHAHAGCRGGFQPVERLEQYAFLLNVAVRRLYVLLKKRGVIPLSPALISTGHDSSSTESPDSYRQKTSIHLDRKLSATARLPKRSTIVESPAGKSDATSSNQHAQQIDRVSPYPQSYQGGTVHLDRKLSATARLSKGSVIVESPAARSARLSDATSSNRHAQQIDQASPYPQSYQDGIHPPYSTLFPNDPTSQPSQVIRPAFGRNNTEAIIVEDRDHGSPAPKPLIPPVRPPVGPRSRPGPARAVHASPLEGLGGHRDDGPGPTPIVCPNPSTEGHSPIPAHEEGITLGDIPDLVEAAQAREQQQSPIPADEEGITLADIPRLMELVQLQEPESSFVFKEEGQAAKSFDETFRQETSQFGQEQIEQVVVRRREKEREGEFDPWQFEIVSPHNELKQMELRKREELEEEVYRQQKVKEEVNREEAARKEQERLHREQEEHNQELFAEASGKDGGQFKEATHGGAERSQMEQEPIKRLSSFKLSNILHMNWASRTRAWPSSRSSFNFSRTSLVSYSTVSEQGDDSDGMMDWERRQEEIYQRQRDQFRQEQERFESS